MSNLQLYSSCQEEELCRASSNSALNVQYLYSEHNDTPTAVAHNNSIPNKIPTVANWMASQSLERDCNHNFNHNSNFNSSGSVTFFHLLGKNIPCCEAET